MSLDSFAEWLKAVNPYSAVLAASFASYLIFKRLEPALPAAHFVLLGLVPLALSSVAHPLLQNTLANCLATAGLYYAFILLFVSAYRLSPFHPLAKYPGPVLNRLTKFKMIAVQATGKQHIYYQELFAKYGEVVRTGPNELMFVNADVIQPIMGSNGLPKGPFWDHRDTDPDFRGLIGIRDPVEAAKRRKLWQRGFTPASLEGYEELIVQHIRELCEAFDKRIHEPIDLSKWTSYFSFDFMGDLLFGQPFSLMQEGRDSNGYWDLINSGLEFNSIAHAPWVFRYLFKLPTVKKVIHKLETFGRGHVDMRVTNGSKYRDLFYHLIDEDGIEKQKPPRRQLYSDAILAIVAGSDTTASVLSALWFYLLQNKHCIERLQAEIDEFYPDRVEPTDLSKQPSMPYLNACVNEALRLGPPVISGVQRHVGRGTGGKAIGRWFVPEQTQVFVHIYSIHRDPRYFSPYAESFWPDRWLPESERKYPGGRIPNEPFAHDTQAFIPFSFGPARCVGKKLAIVEMRAVVCFLMQRFDFDMAPDYDAEKWSRDLKDFFVVEKGELPALLKQRN